VVHLPTVPARAAAGSFGGVEGFGRDVNPIPPAVFNAAVSAWLGTSVIPASGTASQMQGAPQSHPYTGRNATFLLRVAWSGQFVELKGYN